MKIKAGANIYWDQRLFKILFIDERSVLLESDENQARSEVSRAEFDGAISACEICLLQPDPVDLSWEHNPETVVQLLSETDIATIKYRLPYARSFLANCISVATQRDAILEIAEVNKHPTDDLPGASTARRWAKRLKDMGGHPSALLDWRSTKSPAREN